MKHKLLFGFATAAMAAVMCVGFAACGGGVDAAGVKGVEVSKEQWEAAAKDLADKYLSNELQLTVLVQKESTTEMSGKVGDKELSFSGTQSSEVTYVINGKKASAKGEQEVKLDGDEELLEAMHMKKPDSGKTEYEAYSEETDDGTYVTAKDKDGKWVKQEGFAVYSELVDLLDLGDYEEYVYNQDLKGYVDKDYDAEKDTRYTVYKFNKDGKLVAIYTHSDRETEEGGFKSSVKYEYGYSISYEAKDVNIPSAE